MIFLVQIRINKRLRIFQRPQIALTLQDRAIWKNVVVLIYSKLHSKSWLLHKSTGFSSFDSAYVMTLLSLPRWNQLLEYFGRP